MSGTLPPAAYDLPDRIRYLLNPGRGVGKRLGRELLTTLRDGHQCSTLETAEFSMDPEENKRIKAAVRLYMQTWVTPRFAEAITAIEIATGNDPG
jgi:hypothetical protein